MLCNQCGNEIPENANYCPICGAPLSTVSAATPDNKESPSGNHKNTKVALLAVLGLVLIAICSFGYIFLQGGRSKDKVVAQFEQAFNDQDDQTIIKLMFPKDQREAATDYSNALLSRIQSYHETVGTITISIADEADMASAPDAIETSIKDLLSQYQIPYDSFVLANMQLTYEKEVTDQQTLKKLNQIIFYQTNNKWYILPWSVDYIIECRQNADIQTATAIGTALSTCASTEDVYNSLLPFAYSVIPMSEVKYLPEIFQQSLTACLGCSPEELTIQHNADGATGFAFMLDASTNQFHVYISNGQYMNAWDVLPVMDAGYVSGEVTTGTDKIAATSCCYARLISGESPMLGYWQADGAGIYIGYNTSGGAEGLAVYYTFATPPYEKYEYYGIMSPLLGWTMSGGNGYLSLSRYEGAESYTLTLNEDGTILLHTDAANSILTPSSITPDIRNQFVGAWISDAAENSSIGEELNLTVCTSCGYLHTDTYADTFHGGLPFVELYDGTHIHYIWPDTGLYIEGAESGWNGVEYGLNADGSLSGGDYRHGGGGGFVYHYIKADSEQGAALKQVLPALNAYTAYLGTNIINYQYALIYINEDAVPELYCSAKDMSDRFILAYNQKKDKAISIASGGFGDVFSYREREGIIFMYHGMHQYASRAYYQLSKNGTKCKLLSSASAIDIGTGEYADFMIDDQPVDEQAFRDYDKKYGELKACGDCTLYNSIADAYNGD